MRPVDHLLWREWRRNRTIFLLALGIIAALVLMVSGAGATDLGWIRRPSDFGVWIAGVAYLATWIAILVGTFLLPLIAANTLAGEQGDRSAEFIAPLPVSRVVRLAAKVALLAAVAIALWAPMLSVASFLVTLHPVNYHIAIELLGLIATFTLLATALAWMIAALIESPVIAAMAGIAIPFAIPIVLFNVPTIARLPAFRDGGRDFFALWFTSEGMPQPITFLVAAMLFGAGSVIYLRRLA